MKKSYYLGMALGALMAAPAWAQTGTYEFVGKDFRETYEIKKNQRFEYTYKTDWTKSTTSGTWAAVGGDKIALSSEQQIRYAVDEALLANGRCRVLIEASTNRRGPRKIESVYINGDPQNRCSRDSEATLEAVNAQQKRLQTLPAGAERDSLQKAYPTVFFNCEENLTALDSITIKFDKQTVTYAVKSPSTSRELRVRFELLEDDLYKYLHRAIFVFDKKTLRRDEEKSAIFKKK